MPSNHYILCHPLLLLPSIFPNISVFSSESILPIRWPKYWSFSFSMSPSNRYSGLISFRMNSLISLQSKGLARVFSNTIVQSINCSALSLLYGPTLTSIHDYWKSHSFVYTEPLLAKWCLLLFHTLSRFVTAFLPRSKHLLILCLQSRSTVISESKEMKSVTVSTFSSSICHEVMGLDAMILAFWMLSFKDVKTVYFHSPHLTSLQSTSGKMLDWITHKLEWRLLGEISTTSDMQMIPP